jgi:hypothetical protein
MGKIIGHFNIDNGKLKSIEFTQFCASKDISSAQNGHVECVHYTLFNLARTMRAYTELPPNCWDEFILTANYLCMHVPLNDKTPYEAYYCHKPNLTHLWEISSQAFVLTPNKHKPKVFQHSEECVLIVYGKDLKSYWCYHRTTHKVVESFHVVFIESKDDCKAPFQPGVIQELNDESTQQPEPPLTPMNPNPDPNLKVSTTFSVITDPIPSIPFISPPATQPAPSTHVRWSSCIPNSMLWIGENRI